MKPLNEELGRREPDPEKTVLKAIAILAMLVVAVAGMCYTGWLLLTLPAQK